VGKDFSNWIKDRIEQYDFLENQDFVCSPVLATNGKGGHNRKDYHITLDMAKELAMVERNEKGKQARQYFIECEKRLKSTPIQVPQTLPEALRLAADLAEKNTQQSELIEKQKPAVEFVQKYAEGMRKVLRWPSDSTTSPTVDFPFS
jgi:phage anti-repressor protein